MTLEKGGALVVVFYRSSDQLFKLGGCSRSSEEVLLGGCQYQLKCAFVLE